MRETLYLIARQTGAERETVYRNLMDKFNMLRIESTIFNTSSEYYSIFVPEINSKIVISSTAKNRLCGLKPDYFFTYATEVAEYLEARGGKFMGTEAMVDQIRCDYNIAKHYAKALEPVYIDTSKIALAKIDWTTDFVIKPQPITIDLPIKKVIFDGPATIVFWADDTKTVVKARKRDRKHIDHEKGLAMAIAKKFLGTNKTKSNYYDIFKEWCGEEE